MNFLPVTGNVSDAPGDDIAADDAAGDAGQEPHQCTIQPELQEEEVTNTRVVMLRSSSLAEKRPIWLLP